jgi:hypothetical protein
MRTYAKLMENMTADRDSCLKSECPFHQSEIFVEQQSLGPPLPVVFVPSRLDELNRAIVTF